ncbi:MAG TPA: glucosidase, partial [Candidatus Binatia bacterium]
MEQETLRLRQTRELRIPWKKWGPYLSERQWGTVREDYSEAGDAWNYFPHDQSRSRAYRWGEDGLAGISDDRQRLCFALALWNGKDPILKERLFGLTNSESNHGEDVKEYYFYLDSTPTHSYMKYLYKYPQRAYPYDDLVQTSRRRSRRDFEYELLDTGVFDENRYFDVFVEYAKASPEDILIQISVYNRGASPAPLDLLPTLWFRNLWSWQSTSERPRLEQLAQTNGWSVVRAVDAKLGERYFYCDGQSVLLFTENETNTKRIYGTDNRTPYVKDGINDFIVHAQKDAVNPENKGTKVAAHYHLTIEPGAHAVVRLRLSDAAPDGVPPFGKDFDEALRARRNEADEFYAALIPDVLSADEANVMRQALAGMLWSKQFYHYDVNMWLDERGCDPFKATRKAAPRNDNWHHMYNGDVISMPDKWEYPWYAAWDLAFHVIAL